MWYSQDPPIPLMFCAPGHWLRSYRVDDPVLARRLTRKAAVLKRAVVILLLLAQPLLLELQPETMDWAPWFLTCLLVQIYLAQLFLSLAFQHDLRGIPGEPRNNALNEYYLVVAGQRSFGALLAGCAFFTLLSMIALLALLAGINPAAPLALFAASGLSSLLWGYALALKCSM